MSTLLPIVKKERHSVNVYGTASYVENAAEDFHIFALEWYEDCLKFFVDEKCTYVYHKDPQRPDHWRFDFDNPQFLILNLAIGGVWGGEQGIDDSIFPVKYYVDWVRYYK
ncbi:family 16 glycosylhydrolase [Bacteroides faecis]|nr:family 16 glycosylhydrolase [Bacteroides faecis]